MTTPTWSLRRLPALDDAQIDELAGVLIDCVEGGASVSFMHPLAAAGRAVRHDSVLPQPRRLCSGLDEGNRMRASQTAPKDIDEYIAGTSFHSCRMPGMSHPLLLGHTPQRPAPAADGRIAPVHQVLHEVLKDRGIDLVVNLLALSFREHESRVAKDSQVT
jgi:hypothetical protein